MIILGAGMAGLLAANLLRRHKPVIWEQQTGTPSNHEALLRFRSETISELTRIPFKKVSINKAVYHNSEIHATSNLRFANMYAQKVSGKVHNRSILSMEPAVRWIAPVDFIDQLAISCDIEYGMKVVSMDGILSLPIISTIPMPTMMRMVEWPGLDEVKFTAKSIWVLTAEIEDPSVDVYQTIYVPDPALPFYRISITGNRLIAEFIEDPSLDHPDMLGWAQEILEVFGIKGLLQNINFTKQSLGKIAPIDNNLRKQFIMAMTNQRDIYSLGRFATWRNLILDDLVHDIGMIDDFIITKDNYQRTIHSQRSK